MGSCGMWYGGMEVWVVVGRCPNSIRPPLVLVGSIDHIHIVLQPYKPEPY